MKFKVPDEVSIWIHGSIAMWLFIAMVAVFAIYCAVRDQHKLEAWECEAVKRGVAEFIPESIKSSGDNRVECIFVWKKVKP